MFLVDRTSLSLDLSIWNPSQHLGFVVPFDDFNITDKSESYDLEKENETSDEKDDEKDKKDKDE